MKKLCGGRLLLTNYAYLRTEAQLGAILQALLRIAEALEYFVEADKK